MDWIRGRQHQIQESIKKYGILSIELIGEECGDSPKQVQLHRFFPVTYTAEQIRREILEMLKLNMKKYWDA